MANDFQPVEGALRLEEEAAKPDDVKGVEERRDEALESHSREAVAKAQTEGRTEALKAEQAELKAADKESPKTTARVTEAKASESK